MATAVELFEEWRRFQPPKVDFDEVVRVVEHFFASDEVRKSSRGSHLLIIEGPIMENAVKFQANGYSELAFLRGPVFSIPAESGRRVKRIYLHNLVKLIEFKIHYDNLKKQKS